MVTKLPGPSAYIYSEVLGETSRGMISMAPNSNWDASAGVPARCRPGTVVGRVTASGLYTPVNPRATDGTQTARAVLYWGDVADEGGAALATIGHAKVRRDFLVFGAKVTEAQKVQALADLEAVGIVPV